MPEVAEPTLPPELEEGATTDEWREKYKRWYLQLRGLGWESMMLDKVMRQNAIARETAVRAANGTLGEHTGGMSADDDMGIRIGDEVHNHFAAPAQQAAPPAAQPQANSATGGLPDWVKSAATIAIAAAGGGGLATAIPAAIDYMTPDNPPAVVQPDEPTTIGIVPGGVKLEVVNP